MGGVGVSWWGCWVRLAAGWWHRAGTPKKMLPRLLLFSPPLMSSEGTLVSSCSCGSRKRVVQQISKLVKQTPPSLFHLYCVSSDTSSCKWHLAGASHIPALLSVKPESSAARSQLGGHRFLVNIRSFISVKANKYLRSPQGCLPVSAPLHSSF